MPNENDMPNEKDMLIEAYRIQVERWNKRRDIEWRLTLTLWSTILITTFALAGKIRPHWFDWFLIFIIYVVLFGIYCFWICNLWKRNDFDKERMYNYQKKINKKLSHLDIVKPNDAPKEMSEDWSALSQLFFTSLILVCSFLILYVSRKSEPSLLSLILKTLIKKF